MDCSHYQLHYQLYCASAESVLAAVQITADACTKGFQAAASTKYLVWIPA
jgi:hypothetical protein